MKRRLSLILLITAICVLLTSCGGKTPTEPQPSPTPYPTTDVTFHQLSFKAAGTWLKSESISAYAPNERIRYSLGISPIDELDAYACNENLAASYLNDSDYTKETVTLNGSVFTKCTRISKVASDVPPPTYDYTYVYIIQGTQCWYMISYTENIITGNTSFVSFLPQFEESLKYDPSKPF